MQQIKPNLDTIIKSDSIIEKLNSIPKVSVNNIIDNVDAEKIGKTFLNLPLELANILIPVLITIFLFFIGYLLNWLMQKSERKRELESIKSTVTNWIDLIEKPIKNQISYCNTFAENLKKSTDLQPEILNLNQLHASKLKELNLKQLIETFITNLKGTEPQKSKDLFNLVSQIEYFSNIELKLPEAYKIYQDHTFELMRNWNKSLMELDDFKSSMVQEIGTQSTHSSYAFLVQMNNISHSWARNHPKEASLNFTKTQLLDPLFQLANNTITKNSNDIFAPVLFAKVQELTLVFKRKVSHFEGNAKNFESYVSNMNLAYKTLKTTSDKLKEVKLTSIWKIK